VFPLAHVLVLILVDDGAEHIFFRICRGLTVLQRLGNLGDRFALNFVQVCQFYGRVVGMRLKLNLEGILVVQPVNGIELINVDGFGRGKLGQHQVKLRVVGASMHYQHLLKQRLPQLILGQHAFNGEVHNLCGVFQQQLFHVDFPEATEVLRMVSILLGLLLFAANKGLGGVDNHADVALARVLGVVSGLVFASNEDSAHLGHATERKPGGVKQVIGSTLVLNGDVAGLGVQLWGHNVERPVDKVVGDIVHVVAGVHIERSVVIFLLGNKGFGHLVHLKLPFVFDGVVLGLSALSAERVKLEVLLILPGREIANGLGR
jgi:hypothetical protein